LRHGQLASASNGLSPSVLRISPMYLRLRLRRGCEELLDRFSPVDSSLYEMVPELQTRRPVCRPCQA
jgi:hypothetical protein